MEDYIPEALQQQFLLAIKLALEEWRHWLEGAQHPFTVITDHKNLEYLYSAKRLNPRQASWALFFTRFQFTITYRPGEKNVKADSFSRIHAPEDPPTPELILPPAILISPIQWDLNNQKRAATVSEPTPLGGPEGKIYVPTTLRKDLLGSLHASPGSGHPGSQQTLTFLQAYYWWPSMARDVSLYVQGCSVCAISKTPRHLTSGKLVPLPIPHRPWSHVGVDFVTDLPNSDGFTCILIAVDRFSKACKDCYGNSRSSLPSVVSQLWYPRGNRLRPQATVHFPRLDCLLQTPQCLRQPLIWISPSDKWPD